MLRHSFSIKQAVFMPVLAATLFLTTGFLPLPIFHSKARHDAFASQASVEPQTGIFLDPSPAVASVPGLEEITRPSGFVADQSTDEELKTDDGTTDGIGVLQDNLVMVNRLTPSSYPATLKTIRIYFTDFQGQPSPIGKSVRLVVFVDPSGSGRPPANPVFLVDQREFIPQTLRFVDFPVAGPTITSGDLYVGYQAPSPAGGVGFAADTNGPQTQRAYFSTDNGAAFQGPAQFSDGTKFNLLIRAVVTKQGGNTPDFTLSMTPPSQNVPAGGAGTFSVGVQGTNGFSQTVNLSVSINPSGNIGVSVSPTSVTPGGSTQVFVSTSSTTPKGTYGVTVTGVSGTLSHTVSATVAVTDSSGLSTVTVTATDATASEAATDFGILTVSRMGNTASAVTLNVTLGGKATVGADYQLSPATITIPAGSTALNVLVLPVDDTLNEGDEDVVFTLVSGAGYLVGTPSQAVVTIADNDAVSTVSITAETPSITEMSVGAFTVTREGALGKPVTVRYSVSGTTVSDVDYAALSGAVEFAANVASAAIPVMPLVDTQAESSETIVVQLTAGEGYQVGAQNQATLTITDNTMQGSGSINPDQGGMVATPDGAGVIVPPGFADGSVSISFTQTAGPPAKKKTKQDQVQVSGEYALTVSPGATTRGLAYVTIPVVPTLFPTTKQKLVFQPEYSDGKSKKFVAVGHMTNYDGPSQQVTFGVQLAASAAEREAARRMGLQAASPATGKYRIRVYVFTLAVTAVDPKGRFDVTYYPPGVTIEGPYPAKSNAQWASCTGVTDRTHPNYVIDISENLNALYPKVLALEGKPFADLTFPREVTVTDCSGNAGESGLGGPILLSNSKLENCLDMKTVAAHELIHVFQGQKYTTGKTGYVTSWMLGNGWFVEAVANYYAAEATSLTESQKAEFWKKDGGITEYLSVPLTEYNDNSMYAVAHFLDWASDKYGRTLVADTLKRGGVTSPVDLNNLSAELRAQGVVGGVSEAYDQYGRWLLTHPDGYAGLNGSIKSALMTYAYAYKSLSHLAFNESDKSKVYFITLSRAMKPLTTTYVRLRSSLAKDGLLVIDSTGTTPTATQLTSYTYDFIGTSDGSYSGRTPLDEKDMVPYDKPLTIKHFGEGQPTREFEQMIVNRSLSETPGVGLSYYVLVAPEIKEAGGGRIRWTFEGIGHDPGLIPPEKIQGFNIYDTDGVKLNTLPVSVPGETNEATYSHPLIGQGGKFTVTVVDVHGNQWPEVKETGLTLDKLSKATINVDMFFKSKDIKYFDPKTGEEKTYTVQPFNAQAAFSMTPGTAAFASDSISAAGIKNDYGFILDEFLLSYSPGSRTVSSVSIKARLKSCTSCEPDSTLEMTTRTGTTFTAVWSPGRVTLVELYRAGTVTSAFEFKYLARISGLPPGVSPLVEYTDKDLQDTLPGYSAVTSVYIAGTR